MAVDAFLKLGDLKGESPVDGHEDEIQILSWSWGVSQSGTTHRGSGGGAGKADVQDMSLTHYVDTASPALLLGCCTGKHYDEAVLTLRKAGEKPLDYLKITLKEVIITSVSSGGSSGSEEIIENFTLNFAMFTFAYQPQDNKGAKKGGAIEVNYDIAKNV
jgi:type VI secretion system secreted protein Hcp